MTSGKNRLGYKVTRERTTDGRENMAVTALQWQLSRKRTVKSTWKTNMTTAPRARGLNKEDAQDALEVWYGMMAAVVKSSVEVELITKYSLYYKR